MSVVIYLCRYDNLDKAKSEILKAYSNNRGCDVSYRIEHEKNGRPLLFQDKNECGEISISHTDNMLAIAFSNEKIGIDIERSDRRVNNRVCADIREWTRYEAYGKWLGNGISRELLSRELPQDYLRTYMVEDFYLSVCSQSRERDVITIIDNDSTK